MDQDQRLRLRGEGEVAEMGGTAGDLYVQISIKPHAIYQRQESHVVMQLPITMSQAALGAEVDVPTLHGLEKLKIPAGTQSGEVFKIRGKGIKRLNGSGHGDHVVQVIVETPSKLSSKQKQAWQELERLLEEGHQPAVEAFWKKVEDLKKHE